VTCITDCRPSQTHPYDTDLISEALLYLNFNSKTQSGYHLWLSWFDQGMVISYKTSLFEKRELSWYFPVHFHSCVCGD